MQVVRVRAGANRELARRITLVALHVAIQRQLAQRHATIKVHVDKVRRHRVTVRRQTTRGARSHCQEKQTTDRLRAYATQRRTHTKTNMHLCQYVSRSLSRNRSTPKPGFAELTDHTAIELLCVSEPRKFKTDKHKQTRYRIRQSRRTTSIAAA